MGAMQDRADPLMSIGLFSRASLASVKALRLYHEQGLLIPAAVDSATGYRSSRVSQLADARVIKRLRDLDVPLRDVAHIVVSRDPQVTRGDHGTVVNPGHLTFGAFLLPTGRCLGRPPRPFRRSAGARDLRREY
jgi:hypothetical protein